MRPVPQRVIQWACAVAALLVPLSCESAEPVEERPPSVSEPEIPGAPSQPPPSEARELDAEALSTRRAAVLEEIAQLGPDPAWAGAYTSRGTDSGTEIAVAPLSGYVVTASGAFASRTLACGRLEEAGSLLKLVPEHPLSGDWSRPPTLVPVRWGERRYLLFEDLVVNFCNDVNSGRLGSEPSRAYFTLQPDAPVFGKPLLPQQYNSWLLETPIEAAVLSKSDRTILLDAGGDDGVFKGMRFYKFGFFAAVRSVQESTCEAVCSFPYLFDELQVGSKLSTRDKSKD